MAALVKFSQQNQISPPSTLLFLNKMSHRLLVAQFFFNNYYYLVSVGFYLYELVIFTNFHS